MMPRYFLVLLLLLLTGCGGGSSTSSPPPAAVRLSVTGVGTDSAGNDVVTVTATVTDAAGHPVSCPVRVRVNAPPPPPPPPMLQGLSSSAVTVIDGTSDGNGRLSLPVAVDPLVSATITAVAGPVTSNTVTVSSAGYVAASALVAVISTPDGRYSVNCAQFDNIAGIGVTVQYDPTTASEPVVEAGTFAPAACLVWNADTPGTLRIAGVMAYPQTLPAVGALAVFRFTQEAATLRGAVSSVQTQLYDVSGEPVPARTLLINSRE